MVGEEPNVSSLPAEEPATERARWLAAVAEALNEAHSLLSQLDSSGAKRSEAAELYLRIEAARLEVQSLRLSRSLKRRDQFDPEWTDLQPWVRTRSHRA